MLKWTLRSSAQPGGRRAAPVTAHDIRPDARYSTDSSLRDSNKCWSETQVKVAQVKSTLKLTKENQFEKLYEENCDSLECSSNYSSSKTSRSSLRSNKSSTADAKEDKRRKKLSKNLRCATLIAGSASDSDASSGVYMQLHHTPVALLQPCGPSTGHDDPRRRPLIDVSNGDYDDVKKHLQNVYLKHPLAENCLLADSVQERAKTCNFSCIADSNALVTSEAETDTGSTPDVIGCHQEFIEEKEGMQIETHQEVTRDASSEHGHDLRHDCRSVVSGGNGLENSLGTAGTVRDDTEYRGRRPEPLGASVPSGAVDQQIPSAGKLRSSTRIEGFFKDVFRSAHNPRRSLRSRGATAAVTQSKPRQLPEDTSLLPRSSRPFVRDGPEGSSASKLELCSGETKINSLSSKRHSISVFPKEIFLCSVSSKKRLSSYGHKKVLQNRVYDIQIDGDNNDEPSSASHGDGEPKSVDNVNEEIKNSNCLESACTGGIRTRSTFCENALYMSMNGDDIILENSNRDIDTIYSSPKLFRCNDEGKSEANQRDLMHGSDTYVLMTNDRARARLQSTCEMPRKTLHTSYSFPLLLPHRRLLHQPCSDAMVHEHTNAEKAHAGSDLFNSNPKRRSSESSELKTASPRGIRPIYPTPPSPSRRLINRQMLRHSAKDVVQSDIGSSATSCLGVRQTLVKPAELLPCKSCLVYGDLASPSCLCDIPRHDKNSSNRARSNEQSTALNSTSSKTKVSGEYNIDKGNDGYDYSRLKSSSVSLNKPDCDSQSTSNQPEAAHQNNTEQITYSDVISRANGSSNRNLSVIIDRVVHKTLFDSESGSLLEAQSPAAILSRRHSISSSDNVSKELITGSNRCDVSFWNEVSDSSIHLPKFRKYPSESMLFHEYEVPLAASIDKILSQTQQSSFLDPDNRKNFPDLMVSFSLFRQCGENRIRHVLARRKEAGTALPCPIVAGKQVISAQWLKTSSEADLFHTTPGNLTLELPEMGSEQLGTRNMTGASVPNTAARSEHVSECRELKKGTKEEGLLPASKTEEKLLQRQEESSYRLLRLFQDCSIDEVIESDDEDFDSGEWSMHATLDENSTRDPALLDLSCAMLNVDVMRDPEKLDSATVSVIEKLRAISDDKMLAKFRKSFRRKDKDKVDNNLSMFMFVDNPMYLSPEIKKEAKVVNSGFGGTSWFFSNPTYSSPNIIKSKVRSYTRPLSDSVQCEKENIKNLMLAQASSEPIWHQSSAPKVSLLQSNPCYQYSNAMRVSSSDDTQETLPGLAFSQEDINGDNILEHEYCTIPGDEESDSWITQSSGSQQANSSPSSKRHFPQSLSSLCLSSPQSRGRFVLTKDLALTSHNNLKEANCNPIHVYANGPTYNPCSTATTTLAAASYASPRTPRPVKKSCSLRQQFVFGEHPPTVPPPLPSRLRNSIRQSSWAPQELPSHGTFVSQESQSQCADNTHSIGDLRSNQERLDIHGSNTKISATKAFQLPPDGVYESIADAASRRSRSDSSSTNKRVDFESHSDASRVSLLGTCQGLSNGAFETQHTI
ncbi:uncharacterized protein LOC125179552 [Hyalella azteca]|uniref:Uncharacterized protein LOC125179552 n=1 Tax=Hyalella azteca TaxID=294128 RepID=A0A979FWE7_HYAAZ|nr:uncharacterized protein LOC125179552 [Hyalella azteca]